jgi:hypothetical protein
MSHLRLAVLLALCIFCGFNAFAADKLITLDSQDWQAAQRVADIIKTYGGTPKIIGLPHFIIADIPEGVEPDVAALGGVTGIYSTVVDPDGFAAYGPEARHMAVAWNNVFMGQAKAAGLDEEPSPSRRPLIHDADIYDKEALPLRPPGSKYYDVSEFELGSCILGVILPESDGSIDANTEDWTQAEMDEVTSEIISGLNFHLSKKEFRDLSFSVVFNYGVPTGYEPINRSSGEEMLWCNQCFGVLGYPGTYPGYAYANALRDSAGVDWATVVFVVDSSNDADGMFTDGRFGYSLLGGPKFTVTYDNDGWGIANMDAVVSHELCHSFYALDEYQEAGDPCTETSGYLACENQNSEYPYGAGGCAINVRFCIMRSVSLDLARICNYTKGQIGWTDTDGDSIPDILDTFPETVLNAHSPDPDTTQTPSFTGSASVTKLANLNPRGKGNDITLNRIAKVEWRVDGGPWADAIPTDGAWDQGTEDYYFTSTPVGDGTHVYETRAFHTYGNIDESPAVDTLTIESCAGVPAFAGNAIAVDATPNPFVSKVDIAYLVPSGSGKPVPATMRVYDVRGRQVATVLDQMLMAGPGRTSWDGKYSGGRLAPSGIYFIDFIAGETRVVGKMVLAR